MRRYQILQKIGKLIKNLAHKRSNCTRLIMRLATQKTAILEEEEDHPKSSLTTWQVWSLFTLGVLMILLLAGLILKWRRRKESNCKEDESSTKDMEMMMKPSELVFFVEQEEWFKVEELLEGVAELRTQGFCSSLYVVRLNNGAVYAVKRLRRLKVSLDEFGHTMRMVGKLRHPNLLPLVSFNSTPQEKLLVYTFQTNGSLLDLFQSYSEGKRAFPWRLRLRIAEGIARGLKFIHDQEEIISHHGIIKPSNIMLGHDHHPLISEYGYAKFVDTAPSMKGYAAPDTEKADVYSLGVILLELLTGKFVGLDLPRWVTTGEVLFDKDLSDVQMYAFPLLNVSLKCVARTSHDRPAVAEVLHKIEELVRAQQEDA
ncbi:probable inactive receptor kinase At2g26730 [Salvia miltiorrhiza]|uniref:probable inactive receptor kinase At2g26730 n=1 Tax=Salvia miltiorrhiza TaxID=226208 RepID=UPI0025AB9793|nr:probable inactive receptor kinase At2g26730 [Salvia miltiorrhiza]